MAANGAQAPVDLFVLMREGLQPRGTAPVVRLAMSDNSFFDHAYVQKAVDEAQARCAQAAAGIDELSILEQLALQLLCDSAHIPRRGT